MPARRSLHPGHPARGAGLPFERRPADEAFRPPVREGRCGGSQRGDRLVREWGRDLPRGRRHGTARRSGGRCLCGRRGRIGRSGRRVLGRRGRLGRGRGPRFGLLLLVPAEAAEEGHRCPEAGFPSLLRRPAGPHTFFGRAALLSPWRRSLPNGSTSSESSFPRLPGRRAPTLRWSSTRIGPGSRVRS